MSVTESLKNIVNDMIKELETKGDYSFDSAITKYKLPNNTEVKHHYKICKLQSNNFEDELYKKLFSIYEDKAKCLGRETIKKIIERRVVYEYLKHMKMLDQEIKDSESPDFLYSSNEVLVGIEVCCAISQAEALSISVKEQLRIKDFEKFTKNMVKKIGENGYMAINNSEISKKIEDIVEIIDKKLEKIKKYAKCSRYILLVDIANPLIEFKYYKEELRKAIPKPSNVSVFILPRDKSNQRIIQMTYEGINNL